MRGLGALVGESLSVAAVVWRRWLVPAAVLWPVLMVLWFSLLWVVGEQFNQMTFFGTPPPGFSRWYPLAVATSLACLPAAWAAMRLLSGSVTLAVFSHENGPNKV